MPSHPNIDKMATMRACKRARRQLTTSSRERLAHFKRLMRRRARRIVRQAMRAGDMYAIERGMNAWQVS